MNQDVMKKQNLPANLFKRKFNSVSELLDFINASKEFLYIIQGRNISTENFFYELMIYPKGLPWSIDVREKSIVSYKFKTFQELEEKLRAYRDEIIIDA